MGQSPRYCQLKFLRNSLQKDVILKLKADGDRLTRSIFFLIIYIIFELGFLNFGNSDSLDFNYIDFSELAITDIDPSLTKIQLGKLGK